MHIIKSEISKLFFKVIPNSMSLVRCHIKKSTEPEFSFAKFRVLANINRGVRTVSEIAELHGVSQPAISKLVDCLVNDNYLSRHTHPTDRRISDLKLTSLGKKQLHKIRTSASKGFEPSLCLLSEEEQIELSHALSCLDSFFIKIQGEKFE